MDNDNKIRRQVLSILNAGIKASKPSKLIREKIKYQNEILFIADKIFDLSKFERIYVIGFGKISALMAIEIENILGERITDGLVITNNPNYLNLDFIKVRIGAHPIINEETLIASREILDICKQTSENDLVISLISGGGSALFELLPTEIHLNDLQLLTKLLLQSGSSIKEINKVRKCFSLVKNGGLLNFIKPAKCISLIISDVVGDHLESIASSPTFYNTTDFKEVYEILDFYQLLQKIPVNISNFLLNRIHNQTDNDVVRSNNDNLLGNLIIGRNIESLIAAEIIAKKFNFNTIILSHSIQGEAKEVAKVFSNIIEEINKNSNPIPKPACILAGGETTVTVKGNGMGGRNQELALSTLISLKNSNAKYAFASCGTDGIDGITLAAGGFINNKMWNIIKTKKIVPEEYLVNNDSFHFLRLVNGLINIKPGQTNVMDIMVGIVY